MALSRENAGFCASTCGTHMVGVGDRRGAFFRSPPRDPFLSSTFPVQGLKTKSGGSFGLLREELEVTKGRLLMKEEMCGQLIQENQQLLKSLQTLRREDTNHIHQVKSEAASVVQKLLEEEQLLREANAAMQDKILSSSETLKQKQAQLTATQTSLGKAQDQLEVLKRFAEALQDQQAALEEERNQLRASYLDMKKAVQAFARDIAACEFIIDGHCDYDALVRTVGDGIRRLEVDVLALDAQLFKKGLLAEVPADLLLEPINDRMVPTTEVEKAQRGRRLWQNKHEKVERRLAQQEAEIRKLKSDVDDRNRRIVQLRLLLGTRKAKEEDQRNLGDKYRELLERIGKVEKERDELRKWKANHIFYQRHVASSASPAHAAAQGPAKKAGGAVGRGSFSPSPRHLSVTRKAFAEGERLVPLPPSRRSTGALSVPDPARGRPSLSRPAPEPGRSAHARPPTSALGSGGRLAVSPSGFRSSLLSEGRASAPRLARTVPTPQATPRTSAAARLAASPERTRELSRALSSVSDAGPESATVFLGGTGSPSAAREVGKKAREGERESALSGVLPDSAVVARPAADELDKKPRRETETPPVVEVQSTSRDAGHVLEGPLKARPRSHLFGEAAEARELREGEGGEARKQAPQRQGVYDFLERTPVSLLPLGPRLSHRSHRGSRRSEGSKTKGGRAKPLVTSLSSLSKKRYSFAAPSRTVSSLLGKTRTVSSPAFQATSSRSWVKDRNAEEEQDWTGGARRRPKSPEESPGAADRSRGSVAPPLGAQAFFGVPEPREGDRGDREGRLRSAQRGSPEKGRALGRHLGPVQRSAVQRTSQLVGAEAVSVLSTVGRRLETDDRVLSGKSDVRLPRAAGRTSADLQSSGLAREAPDDGPGWPRAASRVTRRTLELIAGRVPRTEAVASRLADRRGPDQREQEILRHYESLPSSSGRLEEGLGGGAVFHSLEGIVERRAEAETPPERSDVPPRLHAQTREGVSEGEHHGDAGTRVAALRGSVSREAGTKTNGEVETFTVREIEAEETGGFDERVQRGSGEKSSHMPSSFSSPTSTDIIRALELSEADRRRQELPTRETRGSLTEQGQRPLASAFATAGRGAASPAAWPPSGVPEKAEKEEGGYLETSSSSASSAPSSVPLVRAKTLVPKARPKTLRARPEKARSGEKTPGSEDASSGSSVPGDPGAATRDETGETLETLRQDRLAEDSRTSLGEGGGSRAAAGSGQRGHLVSESKSGVQLRIIQASAATLTTKEDEKPSDKVRGTDSPSGSVSKEE
ncbi:conserved hypothetical protein [Neospora caninum Liverpool]|uniref:Uncharacterized protein n=1 Tax=Neospora caninum (strain Liverpool) TaxID=572307 RepID=F0VG40_NEOCL|nr:conserved hypothetical protein [Neospora caninum Liverpool]CBZ52684.1 conserved hypothetical protein [Neospora caninum Liverpool]CEL66661.1 TPA: hypothetical protein BN1204_024720 [Neospora caninum Liverpool]|eukprot:XP_003882716.1 conserved hypothetical protein [Neospora caninum Liverpool]